MLLEPLDKQRDLICAGVRRTWQTVDVHPGRSRRYPWIAWIQVLMKMRNAESDDRDVNALHTLSSQRVRYGSRSCRNGTRLPVGEVAKMIDMSARHDHAMPAVRLLISVGRREMERNRFRVAPQQASR